MLDAGLSIPMDMPAGQTPKEVRYHPITRKSAQDYITFATVDMARQSNTATYKSVDIVNIGGTTAYCRPSEESISLSGNALHGQDAISVVVAENVHIISQADGTSQSYLGEIAAKAATQSISNNPSVNPETNLQTAIKAVTDQHNHLPDPDLNIANLTRQALLSQKDYGSETMLNIYSIDEKNRSSLRNIIRRRWIYYC